MGFSRREFLKLSAVTGAGLMFGFFDLKPIVAFAQANPPVWAKESISVCGYCSVGCSMIVGSQAGGAGGYVTYVREILTARSIMEVFAAKALLLLSLA